MKDDPLGSVELSELPPAAIEANRLVRNEPGRVQRMWMLLKWQELQVPDFAVPDPLFSYLRYGVPILDGRGHNMAQFHPAVRLMWFMMFCGGDPQYAEAVEDYIHDAISHSRGTEPNGYVEDAIVQDAHTTERRVHEANRERKAAGISGRPDEVARYSQLVITYAKRFAALLTLLLLKSDMDMPHTYRMGREGRDIVWSNPMLGYTICVMYEMAIPSDELVCVTCCDKRAVGACEHCFVPKCHGCMLEHIAAHNDGSKSIMFTAPPE